MKRFITLLFLVFSVNVYCCEIRTGQEIYIIDELIDNKDKGIILKSNCSDDVNLNFKEKILEYQGTINGKYIETLVNQENRKAKLSVQNDNITISSFHDLIRKHFDKSIYVSLTRKAKVKSITLDEGDSLAVHCPRCKELGKRILRMSVTRKNSKMESYFFEIEVKKEITALQLTGSVNPMDKHLRPSQLKWKKLKTTSPQDFLQSKKNITFFKVNKSLQAGSFLKVRDIGAINIVKAGTPLSLIYKSSGLNLKTRAIPMSHGKIGDVIRLRLPNKKQPIYGKVVNFNKAEVEL